MADIKTRESLHTVKTFDRVQNLAAKTRNGVDEAKQEKRLKQRLIAVFQRTPMTKRTLCSHKSNTTRII